MSEIEIVAKPLGERVSALEAKMERLDEINEKLDDLLALKNKGAGAFWLISALFGTSFVMAFTYITGWFRPH